MLAVPGPIQYLSGDCVNGQGKKRVEKRLAQLMKENGDMANSTVRALRSMKTALCMRVTGEKARRTALANTSMGRCTMVNVKRARCYYYTDGKI